MRGKSVAICVKVAKEVAEFCHQKKVPFGFNIESISARKIEIEASEQLLTHVKSWPTEFLKKE
jgi:hypothetical protein